MTRKIPIISLEDFEAKAKKPTMMRSLVSNIADGIKDNLESVNIAEIKNHDLIIKSLTGQKVDAPVAAAPEPEGGEDADIEEMIQTEMLNEMRIRDLNEISQVIMKEDFYAFINAGNNVLRSLEENGRSVNEAKKYLGYLVKHNIM